MGGRGKNTRGDVLAGVQLQTSSYGQPLPLVYGTARVVGNMVDYDDFVTIANTQRSGKGGGGGSQTTYSYTCGAILAVCHGPAVGINRVFCSQAVNTMAFYGHTLLLGTMPQTAWATWTTKHPTKALPYSGMVLVCNDGFDLGTSGTMPNFSFEVTGLLATELDNGSLISIGTGDGTNVHFQLLDPSGNPISDSTTPPMKGYVNPTYYVNGVQVTTGISLSIFGGFYCLTFVTAPVNGAAVAWSSTAVGLDAKPPAVFIDFLTNANHGAGLSTSKIAPLTTGSGSWGTYCTAMGFAVSPNFSDQKAASDHIKTLLDATNSDVVWTALSTGMALAVIPYGDAPITANGVTFTPNITPIYALGYDDFLGVLGEDLSPTGTDPITVTRVSNADVFNVVPVEFLDRMNAYNASSVQESDPVDVALNGSKVGSTISLHLITRRAHAQAIARIAAQRNVYIRNTYAFQVGWKYILLEPMDLVTISDPKLGITNLVVRIISIEYPESMDETGGLKIVAEGWPFGTGTPPIYGGQASSPPSSNRSAGPGSANAPVIFDVAPQDSVSGGPEIIMATSGGPQWGGCVVWGSEDGSTYTQIGGINGPCRYGVLTGAMTVGGGATVDLTVSGAALTSAPTSVGTDLQTKCWVSAGGSNGSGGELVSYSTATLTSAFNYTLTLPVRGAEGTVAATHASGSSFVRMDGNVFRYPVPASRLGSVLYIKLTSFNLFGSGLESLASVPAYTYTPTAQGTYANQGSGGNGSGTPSGSTINQNSVYALTNSDKIALMTQYNSEVALQCGTGTPSSPTAGSLDAQANSLSVAHSGTNSYDAALAALSTQLQADGAPSNWSTIWPDGTTLVSANPILTHLATSWATVIAARTVLQTNISNAIATAAANAASAAAAMSVITKLNIMGLKNPTAAAWAYSAKPALPSAWAPSHAYSVGNVVGNGTNTYTCTTAGTSGSVGLSGTGSGIVDGTCVWNYTTAATYAAGSCWTTTDGHEVQVTADGSGWQDVVVAATGIFGQLVAGQLTVANFDNLIPNPTSEQSAPSGGWPSGAYESVGLSTNNPRTGTTCRLIGGQSQITPWIPCSPGDSFFLSVWAQNYSTGVGRAFMCFFNSSGGTVGAPPTGNAIVGSYTNLTIMGTAPAGAVAVAVYLLNSTGTDAVWFDDMYFRRCSDASMIVDGTVQALMLRVNNDIQGGYPSGYMAGSATSAPVGFRLSAIGFTSYPISYPSIPAFQCQLEIGKGINLGGYPLDSLGVAKLYYTTNVNGTGNCSWSVPGTYTWKAPIIGNLTSYQVLVTLVGGGGGGAGGASGGGGGGGTIKFIATVTPGTSYTIVVGSGGTAGTPTTGGGAGGNTTTSNSLALTGIGSGYAIYPYSTGGSGGTYAGNGGAGGAGIVGAGAVFNGGAAGTSGLPGNSGASMAGANVLGAWGGGGGAFSNTISNYGGFCGGIQGGYNPAGGGGGGASAIGMGGFPSSSTPPGPGAGGTAGGAGVAGQAGGAGWASIQII